MPRKERPGARHVHPIGEARPPPLRILRDRMELRQVERNQLGVDGAVHVACPALRGIAGSTGVTPSISAQASRISGGIIDARNARICCHWRAQKTESPCWRHGLLPVSHSRALSFAVTGFSVEAIIRTNPACRCSHAVADGIR